MEPAQLLLLLSEQRRHVPQQVATCSRAMVTVGSGFNGSSASAGRGLARSAVRISTTSASEVATIRVAASG
jgi:hypothetical protein